MAIISADVDVAVSFLEKGEVIGFPTETVYGLAGNIYKVDAIKQIYSVKERPLKNPLIVHIASINQLHEVAKNIPEKALAMVDTFWPGPLTIVLEKKDTVNDIITAGKNSVAVRMPNHPLALAVINKLNAPIAAPSANPFGTISPTSATHVSKYFNDKIPFILDGGNCISGIESTIIGFKEGNPILYRYGSLPVEDIEAVIGKLEVFTSNENSPEAPGMLHKHYSPKTKTILTSSLAEAISANANKRLGIVSFTNIQVTNTAIVHNEVLSPSGSLREAAYTLYAALHILDTLDIDIIIAERMPNEGLGLSINDRLERAAHA